jgi:Ca-activated chloride channel family protein
MGEFHFLRPWWLLAVPPAVLLAWRLRAAADPGRAWRRVVAPHLLPHLLVGGGKRSWLRPEAVAAAGWVLAAVALAGPTWEREPAPFADDEAVLVVVLKVTKSMTTADVPPTRLGRAVQKVHDLLALRGGARTGLVAYAGSAHRVLPPTSDIGVLDSFAGELAPDVMPVEGDAAADALALADGMVAKAGRRGWVLWVCDGADAGQTPALADYRANGRTPVSVLVVAGDGPERASAVRAAATLGAEAVAVTPDDADVRRLAANTHFSAAADGTGERWRDAGYWLTPVLAAVVLYWFRPGWVAGGGVS